MEIRGTIAFLAAVFACNGQTPGSFIAIKHMTSPRSGHTATLLANGKVLIAGGGTLTAEIYDPLTGAFAPTGNMTNWHLGASWQAWQTGQAATLLADGRVLITGANSAELYDPATESFRATGPMTTGGVSATLLNSGKVLIVGGHCIGDAGIIATTVSNAAELYDPLTGTFAPTGNMTTGRCNPRSTLLPDGRVLILPSEEGDDYGSIELYDPSTGTFSALDWNGNGNIASTSNLLVNGIVLAALASQECDAGSEQAVLYDAAADSFTFTGGMVNSICRPTGTLLSDGTVLVAAGPFAGPLAQVYDPAMRRFSPTANLSSERISHTATLLNDGTVLSAGGMSSIGGPFDHRYGFTTLDSAELYHPAAVVPPPGLLTAREQSRRDLARGHEPGGIGERSSNQRRSRRDLLHRIDRKRYRSSANHHWRPPRGNRVFRKCPWLRRVGPDRRSRARWDFQRRCVRPTAVSRPNE